MLEAISTTPLPDRFAKEPRVIDNLGFGEGSTASGGSAAGNYRFVLDGMIRNGASDFTWPRNCGCRLMYPLESRHLMKV
jgi:hypothetical protein